LTTDPASDATAYWSRDGKWIYFASNRTGRLEVWKIPSDGSTREVKVTRNGGWRSRESLDRRTLYYQKLDAPGFWRMPVEGGPEERSRTSTRLTPGTRQVATSFFSMAVGSLVASTR
jgi:hypothetical protein